MLQLVGLAPNGAEVAKETWNLFLPKVAPTRGLPLIIVAPLQKVVVIFQEALQDPQHHIDQRVAAYRQTACQGTCK